MADTECHVSGCCPDTGLTDVCLPHSRCRLSVQGETDINNCTHQLKAGRGTLARTQQTMSTQTTGDLLWHAHAAVVRVNVLVHMHVTWTVGNVSNTQPHM